MVGTVLDPFHQAGDGGVFPERADEFDGYAVFLKKADINAAGIVPHPVLHGVVTEREEGRLCLLSLFDQISDVMNRKVHGAVLSAGEVKADEARRCFDAAECCLTVDGTLSASRFCIAAADTSAFMGKVLSTLVS